MPAGGAHPIISDGNATVTPLLGIARPAPPSLGWMSWLSELAPMIACFGSSSRGAHRYVCIASHGEPPKGKNEAAHICGKGRQGCVNPRHLHWASRAENHAEGAKLRGSGVAPLYRTSKIPNHDIQTIRSMRGNERIAVTAARYGVHESTISLIQSGKRRSQA